STTDSLGLTHTTVYAWTSPDALDWTRDQTVSPPSGSTGLTVTSVYAVRVEKAFQPPVTTYHDRLGRIIRTSKEGFEETSTYIDNVDDDPGRAVETTHPYLVDGDVYGTQTEYDPLGRGEQVRAADGTPTTDEYVGRMTTVTVDAADREPQVTSTLVDAKG